MRLFHPWRRIQLQLPNPSTLPCRYVSTGHPNLAVMKIRTAAMSDNAEVLVVIHESSRLAFCRIGDNIWTHINTRGAFDDVIYHKGQFYVVSIDGRVGVLYIDDINPNVEIISEKFIEQPVSTWCSSPHSPVVVAAATEHIDWLQKEILTRSSPLTIKELHVLLLCEELSIENCQQLVTDYSTTALLASEDSGKTSTSNKASGNNSAGIYNNRGKGRNGRNNFRGRGPYNPNPPLPIYSILRPHPNASQHTTSETTPTTSPLSITNLPVPSQNPEPVPSQDPEPVPSQDPDITLPTNNVGSPTTLPHFITNPTTATTSSPPISPAAPLLGSQLLLQGHPLLVLHSVVGLVGALPLPSPFMVRYVCSSPRETMKRK
ncbi:hypothetical protein MRB53_024791 [Persea americana]|uniref:Uncharacterized protein n=1 Tax=Persea americana TaxID=3435 RepID=A0ACC2LEF4_PERAE|nr:hypothetical protein MRB53_024791 [Persea americana]